LSKVSFPLNLQGKAKAMEESQFKQLLLDAIANVTVATCTSGELQMPLDFVTITKGGVRNGSHHWLCLRIILELAMDMHSHNRTAPIQQDGKTLHLHSVYRIMFFFSLHLP